MARHPLYQPLWPMHAGLLASRRATLGNLLSQLEPETVRGRSSIEKAQLLLHQGAIADDVEKQEAIGILIGDEFVHQAGFGWVTVDDDYSSEPAVAHPSKMAVISPLSAVTSRFEDGDISFDLNSFIEEALSVIAETEIRDRTAK